MKSLNKSLTDRKTYQVKRDQSLRKKEENPNYLSKCNSQLCIYKKTEKKGKRLVRDPNSYN